MAATQWSTYSFRQRHDATVDVGMHVSGVAVRLTLARLQRQRHSTRANVTTSDTSKSQDMRVYAQHVPDPECPAEVERQVYR